MNEQQKIYWKLYKDFYSNQEILKDFINLMDLYHSQSDGKIIDIGCGQSRYIIDFYVRSKHKLFAVDPEKSQIEFLKQRISQIESNVEIYYSTNEFPSNDFKNEKFSGVILSNLLHFMNLNECKNFIDNITYYTLPEAIFVITVHSWKHPSNGDNSYFKHFFKKSDIYKVFPKSRFDYLYFDQISAVNPKDQIEFLKRWVKELCFINNITDDEIISKYQNDFLLKSERIENMTFVLRVK